MFTLKAVSNLGLSYDSFENFVFAERKGEISNFAIIKYIFLVIPYIRFSETANTAFRSLWNRGYILKITLKITIIIIKNNKITLANH